MAENSDGSGLGPWAGDDLGKTAATYSTAGLDADLPKATRFVSGIAKVVRKRHAEAGLDADPKRPAIFLLDPIPKSHDPEKTPKRVPMLNSGTTAVAGRLWFVTAVVTSGTYVDIGDIEDDECLFSVVVDHLKLGAIPAVIYDPRTKVPHIRFYPNGLNEAESCEALALDAADISLDAIFKVIDRIYLTSLVTPEAQSKTGKLWADSGKSWPSDEAEDRVQMYLRCGLSTAFPSCDVRHEQTRAEGRLDLQIEEKDPIEAHKIKQHAVLELKVLRSFNVTGAPVPVTTTHNWIEKGVRQAACYRDAASSSFGALCCFDMRKDVTGDGCFEHVKTLATQLMVTTKNWHLFSTSEQYRKFSTTLPTAAPVVATPPSD